MKHATGDISVFSHNANSLLAYIENVSYETNINTEDGSTIAGLGENACPTKQESWIRTGLFSDSAFGCRVSNLDVSLVQFGSFAEQAIVRGGSFNGTFTQQETSGVADRWKYPQNTKKNYTASLDLVIPTTSNDILSIVQLAHGADATTLDDLLGDLSITINSVTTKVKMRIVKVEHQFEKAGLQHVRLDFSGASPTPGTAYPETPTGSTTLLEKAFNDFNTPYAIILNGSAVGTGQSVKYTGNYIVRSFGFSFQDGQLIVAEYEFCSVGAVTPAAS